jgi:hypothetical protein
MHDSCKIVVLVRVACRSGLGDWRKATVAGRSEGPSAGRLFGAAAACLNSGLPARPGQTWAPPVPAYLAYRMCGVPPVCRCRNLWFRGSSGPPEDAPPAERRSDPRRYRREARGGIALPKPGLHSIAACVSSSAPVPEPGWQLFELDRYGNSKRSSPRHGD